MSSQAFVLDALNLQMRGIELAVNVTRSRRKGIGKVKQAVIYRRETRYILLPVLKKTGIWRILIELRQVEDNVLPHAMPHVARALAAS